MVKISINRTGLNKYPMSEDQAAEKIQASFRGYKARKILKETGLMPVFKQDEFTQFDEEVFEKSEEMLEYSEEMNASEQQSPDLPTDPDEAIDTELTDVELERATAKIRAWYKNYAARKGKLEVPSDSDAPPDATADEEEVDALDDAEAEEENPGGRIDMDDPELHKAAIKIQAAFRGYRVRKELQMRKDAATSTENCEDEE